MNAISIHMPQRAVPSPTQTWVPYPFYRSSFGQGAPSPALQGFLAPRTGTILSVLHHFFITQSLCTFSVLKFYLGYALSDD